MKCGVGCGVDTKVTGGKVGEDLGGRVGLKNYKFMNYF